MKCTFLILFLTTFSSFGQQEYTIDSIYNTCVDTAIGSYNRYLCTENAYGQWDAELNKNYQLCMKLLSEEDQTVLRNAQRIWIQYRDSKIETFLMIVSGVPGTYHRDAPIHLMEITRERALELERYYWLILERE